MVKGNAEQSEPRVLSRAEYDALLRTVQQVLRHTSLKTTSIYVQLAQEAVKRELQEHALAVGLAMIVFGRTLFRDTPPCARSAP